jgi:hypothetical protein
MSERGEMRHGPWLESRLRGVPPELAHAMRDAIGRVKVGPDRTPAEALAEVSLTELCSVTGGEQNRKTALRLLAADALLTYAFEAAVDSEIGGDAAAAERLAERVGPCGYLGECIGSPGHTVASFGAGGSED